MLWVLISIYHTRFSVA